MTGITIFIFTIHDSRFTIYDSLFTIHYLRFTIHDSLIHETLPTRRNFHDGIYRPGWLRYCHSGIAILRGGNTLQRQSSHGRSAVRFLLRYAVDLLTHSRTP